MAATSINCLAVVLKELGWSYTRLIAELRRHASVALPKTESMVTLISRWVNNHLQPDDFYRGRDRRAHHRRPAHGVLRGHGRCRPGRRPGHPRAVAAGHRGPGPGHGGLGAGGQAARPSGRAAAVVAAAGRLRGPVNAASGRRRPTDPGRVCDAGATPVWLLGSFAVLGLLYRADTSADPAAITAEVSAEQRPASADLQDSSAEVLTKRAQAKRAYADLSATGAPPSSAQQNGRPSSPPAMPEPGQEASP
jgi:hypothetical protein